MIPYKTLQVTIYILQKIASHAANDSGLYDFDIKHCGSPFKYCKRLRVTIPMIVSLMSSTQNIAGHHLYIAEDCESRC